MILDGWGLGDGSKKDVISQVETPNMDRLMNKYPHSELQTSGNYVGLPEGQMGNSEVGHLNIGAGRVVFQDLVKINNEVRDNTLKDRECIKEAYSYAKDNNKSVHLMGLVSNGGVHSSDKHIYEFCRVAKEYYGIEDLYVHAFMDGRDTDPKSGEGFLKDLQAEQEKTTGTIASVIGRFYAMDRDKRWDRVKTAYDLLVSGKGEASKDVIASVAESYKNDVTDEFIKPICKVDEAGNPVGRIKEGDVVIFFNFRNDRARELTQVLTQADMPEEGMKTIPLKYYTMTPYDASFEGIKIIYDKENVTNTIGETVAKAGKKQIRIAETEKYAHVTFFFNGGREEAFENENRILINSPKVATYDLKPEMSAYEVQDAIVKELAKKDADFVCLNFANGDMVGHTGDYSAIETAVKVVDECVGAVTDSAVENGYTAMIIADHGNADNALNEDGSVNTAHSTNPVPCVLVSDEYKTVENGILADVAPTLLKIMGVEIPADMTGKVLV